MRSKHLEIHFSHRGGWLRAAVLGANDGLLSNASIVMGVASSGAFQVAILTAGAAGLVAGAMSMAAGEFVSVKSQADAEQADVAREQKELATDPAHELNELVQIYEARGLESSLALKVAQQLMSRDALAAHMRDELGMVELLRANALRAAWASALAFACGAVLPLIMVMIFRQNLMAAVSVISIIGLAALGYAAAHLGRAPKLRSVVRILICGVIAMLASSLIGKFFGEIVYRL
jgi:vacuolar iron transporter family protein